MTSKEKVIEAERQIRALIEAGQTIGEDAVFHCPFCSKTTIVGQVFCCDEAAAVVNAIVDHIEHLERCEIVEKAMDRLATFPSPRVLLN